MLISVSTRPFPLAGRTVSFAAYKSYPAEKALPRVGSLACGESFLTCRGTGASIAVAVASVTAAATASSTAAGSGSVSASSIVLMRLAGGEVVPFSGTADMIGIGD